MLPLPVLCVTTIAFCTLANGFRTACAFGCPSMDEVTIIRTPSWTLHFCDDIENADGIRKILLLDFSGFSGFSGTTDAAAAFSPESPLFLLPACVSACSMNEDVWCVFLYLFDCCCCVAIVVVPIFASPPMMA
uniref:Secreted protein n=1 Tax=Anopheles atroparvus TaxID=41427 RepID=A0AAG5DGI8_ANOAO